MKKNKIPKRSIILIFLALVLFHQAYLQLISKQFLPEMVFITWLVKNSGTFVSEEYFLHPPLLPNLIALIANVFNDLKVALLLLQLSIVVILDFLLFFYLKNRFRLKYAIFGLFFYIQWQVFFRGNALWYDFATIPFVAVSYFSFLNFIKDSTYKHLALATLSLSLGYFFKQTVIWIFIFYFFWILITSMLKKIGLNKFFWLNVTLFLPLIAAIALNSAVLLLKATPEFTIQWSLVIPLLIFHGLSTFSRFISQNYQVVVALLIGFFALSVFVMEKTKKLKADERAFIYLFPLFNIAGIFPWWSDFRLQPFIFFLSILFASGIYYCQFLSKKDIKIFKIYLMLLIAASVLIFTNRIRVEIKQKSQPQKDFISEFAPSQLSYLLKDKNVFGYDTALNLDKILTQDKRQHNMFLITDPDEYYRSLAPKIALNYAKKVKPDVIIIPFQAHQRILSKTNLTVFEDYVLNNYRNSIKINDLLYLYKKD